MVSDRQRSDTVDVIDWRFKNLLEAAPKGCNAMELLELAQMIAADQTIDLHQAVGMFKAGCSLDQVADVLL